MVRAINYLRSFKPSRTCRHKYRAPINSAIVNSLQRLMIRSMAVNTISPKRSLILELVGPAGAGKTTLLQILGQRDKRIRAGLRIPKHGYIKGVFLLLPTFLRIHRPYRGILWKEMKRILYLKALHQLLKQEAAKSYRAIVLDEGPVYMLSRLRVFGGGAIQGLSFEKWWQSAINEWANTVDAIIWLDADNPTLAQRIRTRNQPCPVKDMTDSSLHVFFGRYRAAFEQVISELTAGDGPEVIKFVTHREATEQIADRILSL